MTTNAELVPHPFTGEAIDLSAPTDTLARFRYDIVDAKRQLDELAHILDAELVARMDQENVRSLTAGQYKLETTAAEAIAWKDPYTLGIILQSLVRQERITQDAADKALKQTIENKPVWRELMKLAAHSDPQVSAAIKDCATKVRPQRRVAVNLNH